LNTFFGIKESIGFHFEHQRKYWLPIWFFGIVKIPYVIFLQSACDAASNNPLVAAVTPGVQTCQSARLRH
jgi:hypothetical protein